MNQLTDTVAAAAFAADPVLTGMYAMLGQHEAFGDAVLTAASADSPDFMDGFVAALNLTGLGDLKDIFTSAVLETALKSVDVTVEDVIRAGQGTNGGAR